MNDTACPSNASRPWWIWFNILGLDAVITALLWLPLFGRASGAHLIPGEYVVLGCSVWGIYALDRLFDGTTDSGMSGERHRFAARNFKFILAGAVAAAALSAWFLAFRVREIVLFAGLKLVIAVAVYYAVTWLSRRNWPGLLGAGTLSGLLAVAYMQGTASAGGPLWAQLWRAVLAGFLITVLYIAVRHPETPAPWSLPRKLLGGWLFATGTALAPYAHIEMWRDLLLGAPVVLFGAVCALNSLGIRLWETTSPNLEDLLLSRLYPWMLATTTAGAITVTLVADEYSKPVSIACGIASVLLFAVHATRARTTVSARRAMADGAMIASAALMLLVAR